MGTDKSQLLLNGVTFVQHIAAALFELAVPVTIVGRAVDDKGLKSIPDVYNKWGALGGVHAALAGCTSPWAIIVACDMPYVTADLFRSLNQFRDEFDAVAPVQPDGRFQPLCAFYRVEACLNKAKELIESGERRPITLLQSVRTRWVEFQEFSHLSGASQFFENLNTPDDIVRAQSKGEELHQKC